MDTLAYVRAVAPIVGLELTPDEQTKLADAFALVIRLGAPALECPVDPDSQPAPVFEP